MKKYNGKWIDLFQVSIADIPDRPSVKNKILLETPREDYFFTHEQWKEFKEKVNKNDGKYHRIPFMRGMQKSFNYR